MQRRYPWQYALFMMAYYTTNAVYQGFITVYFRDVGLSAEWIGALMSAVPMVSIVFQPLWGSLGDRLKSRNRLLRALSLAAALSMFAFRFNSSVAYLLPMLCLYAAFFTSIQPMGDSIILEDLQKDKLYFGPLRLAGCLSFALCSALSGRLLEGRIAWVLPMTTGLLCLTAASTYALPPTAGHQKKGDKTSMFSLFKDKPLMELLILFTLLQITMGYFYSFFSVHYTALPGGNSALLGWCYLISAVSEVPFLLLSDRLLQKLGPGKLMCVSAATLTLRWLLLGSLTNIYLVMATQVLHGWGFIVMTVSMAKYISSTVPEALRSRGQMLLAVVGFGCARVVGSLGGGILAGSLGVQHSFFVSAAISFAALCAFAPRYLKKNAAAPRLG